MNEGGSALAAALAALGWLGAGLAALLAAALLGRRGDAAERRLGAGLAVAAAAGALVTASHAGFASLALERSEVAVTLLAGPLFASWVAHAVGWRAPRWLVGVAVAPALGWTLAALSGAPLTADRTAIRWAVGLQIGWSAGATALAARRWPALGAATRRTLGAAGGAVALLHLAQLARLAAPSATPRDLVPAALGVALAAITLAALRQTRLAFGGGGIGDDEAAALVAALDRWLVGERALTERGLTVAVAAERLGVPAARLSRALNRGAGVTFSEHLAALRVAEAERLLADPALAHLAVEAIGGRAGFGSRSVFYAEFRRRTGRTPAEFRERAARPAG